MHVINKPESTIECRQYGVLVNGQLRMTDQIESLYNPYNSQHFADIHLANEALLEESIERARQAFVKTKTFSSYQRSQILKTVVALLKENKTELAEGITLESGKPISAALAEVDRSIFTFEVAAEETLRMSGEIISLDWLPGNEKRHGEIRRQPKGIVAAITPFNFPINLVAHKIAPAMAVGNPILIKPALQTTVSALKLGNIITQAGWPEDAIAVLPCHNDIARPLVVDERIQILSFTGSSEVGWYLKSMAGKKAVTLELGGNAGNIIEADTDLEQALERIVWGGFINSGQACISVQRVYIRDEIYERAKKRLIELVNQIPVGNPWNSETMVGPVINKEAADRIEHCIADAVRQGANILTGGNRHGLVIEPTLIESNNDALAISSSEIFGPVIVISKYHHFAEAVERVSNSDYGLAAGVFTNDLKKINLAIEQLQVGGININDVSTFRIDHMPYGGLKSSGCGREGIKYAIEEMTNRKLITYNNAF